MKGAGQSLLQPAANHPHQHSHTYSTAPVGLGHIASCSKKHVCLQYHARRAGRSAGLRKLAQSHSRRLHPTRDKPSESQAVGTLSHQAVQLWGHSRPCSDPDAISCTVLSLAQHHFLHMQKSAKILLSTETHSYRKVPLMLQHDAPGWFKEDCLACALTAHQ